MIDRLRHLKSHAITRAYDLLVSVYMYNEYQGQRQLEDWLKTLPELSFVDSNFVASVEKHANDEAKHCRMFQSYFRNEKRLPFKVNNWVGYFDSLFRILVGRWGWEVSRDEKLTEKQFARLCQIIVLTETRGIKQLDQFLGMTFVKSHPRLFKVFSAIRKDEPSHIEPYKNWLEMHHYRLPGTTDKIWDVLVHYGIGLVILPVLFFNWMLPRVNQLDCPTGRLQLSN